MSKNILDDDGLKDYAKYNGKQLNLDENTMEYLNYHYKIFLEK